MRAIILATAFACAALPARAEIINLSCDNGGMLLTINTDAVTITDKNPFQNSLITAPLAVSDAAWRWHEGAPGAGGDDYLLDRATNKVSGTSGGASITFANPQCGKSATPRAHY